MRVSFIMNRRNPNLEIKDSISRVKTVVILSVITSILAFLCIFIGDIAAPFAAALYAMLILVESPKRRVVSYAIPALAILADILINGISGYGCIQFTVAGILIALAFRKKFRKTTLTAMLCATFILFIIWGLCCTAFKGTGVYTLESVKDFYFNILGTVKDELIDALTKVPISVTKEGENIYLTVTDAATLVNAVFNLFVSFVAIIAFLLSGITIKIFSAIAVRVAASEDEVRSWIFITTSAFAYAYLAVFVINLFSAGMGAVASAVIANLYLIMMVIYAYLGAKLLLGFIMNSQRRFFFLTIVLFIILSMNFYSLVPLSLLGTYGVIVTNRHVNFDTKE